MNFEYLNYFTKDRIGYITLNRPEKRNALNGKFVVELKQIFTIAENDTESKLIILKAEGEAFCAGADLSYLQELQKNTFEENLEDSRNLMQLYNLIYNLKKIVIAQIQGHAIAGGAGLATVCDFIFSIPEAKYGYSEVNIGFVPAIVSVFLIRKLGEAKAKELLLTGKIIDATEAHKIGIFNFIVESSEIETEVEKFAYKLIQNASSSSLSITKRLISNIQGVDLQSALNTAAETNAYARDTSDCKKGINAFLNKNKITW